MQNLLLIFSGAQREWGCIHLLLDEFVHERLGKVEFLDGALAGAVTPGPSTPLRRHPRSVAQLPFGQNIHPVLNFPCTIAVFTASQKRFFSWSAAAAAGGCARRRARSRRKAGAPGRGAQPAAIGRGAGLRSRPPAPHRAAGSWAGAGRRRARKRGGSACARAVKCGDWHLSHRACRASSA